MKKAPKFNVGDLVQLKSGGPVMVVEAVSSATYHSEESYKCQWFSGKKLEYGHFSLDTLILAPKEDK